MSFWKQEVFPIGTLSWAKKHTLPYWHSFCSHSFTQSLSISAYNAQVCLYLYLYLLLHMINLNKWLFFTFLHKGWSLNNLICWVLCVYVFIIICRFKVSWIFVCVFLLASYKNLVLVEHSRVLGLHLVDDEMGHGKWSCD